METAETDFSQPLAGFYEAAGSAMPPLEPLDGTEMPEPYRRLLVHDRDMTPTLEAAWNDEIRLERLAWHEHDGDLFRRVVLRTRRDGRAVEFGAIRIRLEAFDERARDEIRAGVRPLGRILLEHGISHQSAPTAYFRLVSDSMIDTALGLAEGRAVLYGRHNVIDGGERGRLAEVVEILSPAGPPRYASRETP